MSVNVICFRGTQIFNLIMCHGLDYREDLEEIKGRWFYSVYKMMEWVGENKIGSNYLCM